MRRKFYTYIWFDPKDNIPRYVGKGICTRPFVHLQKGSTTRLSNMLRKRKAEGYRLEPLMIPVETEEEAFLLEKKLIAEIGRLDLNKGPLFNKTDGGDGSSGTIFSQESRKKISESNKTHWSDPAVKAKKSRQMLEYFKSPEAREKASEASSSRYRDPEYLAEHTRARSKMCTVDGIKIYPSQKALAKELGYGVNGVRSPSFRYISGPSYERRSRKQDEGV